MKTCSALLKSSTVFILMLNSFCASSHIDHEVTHIIGCDVKGLSEAQYDFDTDEIMHVDFEKHNVVSNLPTRISLDPNTILDFERVYVNAEKANKACIHAMKFLTAEEDHPPKAKDPPDSIIYPAEEVHLGFENRLICFFNHFYPPPIKVSWTKNDQPVSDGVSHSQFYPNDDQTFHQFSVLKFTPMEGDKYNCTVEHLALESPKTKTWVYDVSHESHQIQTVVPDVVFGVGLTLGLLGVVSGTLLCIKGRINSEQLL
ncbi:RLA class II histocompatibility antigen, DP alpha-1 chain-like [Gouania willdenowi]|uniref:RLA class II histocompatibility antigen, DP alpha-1 chain-like n=1 Tax=Gouania willdenowi TaxID=441366 RepID=A0A8C5I1B6_GOUWI|nr:RLA class II histocompatibility antigen, DP alpha-1 chain-like [Gouania willdenowi]